LNEAFYIPHKGLPKHKRFLKIFLTIEQQHESFANIPTIARVGDHPLSKLTSFVFGDFATSLEEERNLLKKKAVLNGRDDTIAFDQPTKDKDFFPGRLCLAPRREPSQRPQ
jgi:hypothetical protein